MNRSVLAVYLEPAPYIVSLVEKLRAVWDGRVDVAYTALGLSQPWEHAFAEHDILLPPRVPAALAELRRMLRDGRYGLLHLAGWGHPVLLAALLLAKRYGIPVTVESDTQRPAQPGGLKAALKKALYPRLFALADFFLPGGSRQVQYLRDYGVADERIRIARMTVDVEAIQTYLAGRDAEIRARFRARLGVPPNAVCALFMGRLEPEKGIADLVEAFAAVREPGVVLAFAGDGSLRTAVERAAADDDRIRYFGRLSGDAVWDAYCASDLLVLPSRFEPWGLVVNEAMAAGLPVIATDRVGCTDDLVHDGETGVVVPAESPAPLGKAMSRLVRDETLRASLGRKGRALICGWTLSGQAERTVAAWSSLCG